MSPGSGSSGPLPTAFRLASKLRDGMRLRPLNVGGFRPAEKAVLVPALVLVAAWSVVLVLAAVGVRPADGEVSWRWMGSGGIRTGITRVGAYVGFSLSAVLGVAASVRVERAWRRIPMAAAALLLLHLASASLNRTASGPDDVALWAQALRTAGIAAAAVLPVVPLRTRRQRSAAVGLAAASGGLATIGLLLTGGATVPWNPMVDLRNDPIWPIYRPLEAFLVIQLFWGLLEWSRLLVTWGTPVARWATGTTTALVGLVVAKVVWLVAGYTDALPSWLGGSSEVWERSRDDGWASWLTASVLVVLAGVWLVRRHSVAPPEDALAGGRSPGSSVLVLASLAICVPAALGGLLWLLPFVNRTGITPVVIGTLMAALAGVSAWHAGERLGRQRALAPVAAVVGVAAAAFVLSRTLWRPGLTSFLFSNRVLAHFLLVPLVLFLAAAVVLARRDHGLPPATVRVASVLFAVLAAVAVFHAAPQLTHLPLQLDIRDLGATGDRAHDPTAADTLFPIGKPTWERWWGGTAGTFEPQTVDVAVTVLVVALLAARRWARVEALDLLLVLAVSTVFAHAGTLAPSGWAGDRWFHLAFVFPVLTTFAIDARPLNKLDRGRFRRVAASLAVALFLLTIVGWRYLANHLSPDSPPSVVFDAFTRGLDHRFFLAAILAAVLADRLAGPAPAPTGPAPPSS